MMITMTIFLPGAIICSTVYLLDRFTDLNIIEEETTFRKSPNALSKAKTITDVSYKKDEIVITSIDRDEDANEKEISGSVNQGNATIFLSEIVEEATKAAKKNELTKIRNMSK